MSIPSRHYVSPSTRSDAPSPTVLALQKPKSNYFTSLVSLQQGESHSSDVKVPGLMNPTTNFFACQNQTNRPLSLCPGTFTSEEDDSPCQRYYPSNLYFAMCHSPTVSPTTTSVTQVWPGVSRKKKPFKVFTLGLEPTTTFLRSRCRLL